MTTDWGGIVFLASFGGVFGLICWWISWSVRRDRERMLAPERRTGASVHPNTFDRQSVPGYSRYDGR